jgi:hypothetical protein
LISCPWERTSPHLIASVPQLHQINDSGNNKSISVGLEYLREGLPATIYAGMSSVNENKFAKVKLE